jgi:uncharacterized SAM-binding protein YcdF (DUF218 family)
MEALGFLVIPSNLVLLIGLLGVVLLFLPRRRRIATSLLTSAIVLLLVLSSGKTATLLSSPLEYAYPKAPAPRPDSPAKAIVVLTAYATDDPDMPLSGRPSSSALFRIVEAVHLWRACQQCLVIVTGMNPTTKVTAESLVALGIPSTQIRIDSDAANTGGSAVNVRTLLGDQVFYLVTSAAHMPRSMGVFLKQGLRPIPAPTDHQVPRNVSHAEWKPTSLSLHFSDLAVHEHIGILWYRLTGRI